jgi:hypothetical protein
MALVAIWYAVSGVGAYLLGRRVRALRAPVWAGYGLAALAVGGYLALTTIRDKEVHEQVITGAPASQQHGQQSAAAAQPQGKPRASARPPAGPVTEQQGAFVSGEHATTGVAAIVRSEDGSRVLTLTKFDTSAGPDLRVRLVPGATTDGGADGNVDLGGLKGNRGDQQYELPDGLDARGYTVVIWCRAFSASFGSAALSPA